MTDYENVLEIGSQFRIAGELVGFETFGSGHINDTFVIHYKENGKVVSYTLQRINHDVFTNPPATMENIRRITGHLQKKIAEMGCRHRKALRLVTTRQDENYYLDRHGHYWRVYYFIPEARTFEIIDFTEQAYEAARAFAEFACLLADLPGGRLHETIPDFHNTPKRYEAFAQAITADQCGRAAAVRREIEFALERREEAGNLLKLHEAGDIPERITHNDTKINNVLFDDRVNRGICVIDLDTVMPGLTLYDFGDMVRTCTSPAAEDETDLDKVEMRLEMFAALARGYLETASGLLTPAEKAMLPFAGKLICLEQGVRFLTDYLQGDTYYKIKRPEHNLDRARNQLKLVASIERQMPEMEKLTAQIQGQCPISNKE